MFHKVGPKKSQLVSREYLIKTLTIIRENAALTRGDRENSFPPNRFRLIVDLTLRVRRLPHAEREVYDG